MRIQATPFQPSQRLYLSGIHLPAIPERTSALSDTDRLDITSPEVRFFFFSDAHSRTPLLNQFSQAVAQEKPAFLIDGGDIVHDGTEPELKQAYAVRQQLGVPVHMVTGNHDVDRRGPFTEPPPFIPPFQSFDRQGVHFILLDNENETLTEKQFEQLEQDLKDNQEKTTIVAMHVPPKLSQERIASKLKKLLPFKLANTTMREPAQVKRFMALMAQYGVTAVLTGHTHAPDEFTQDGVQYIVVGPTGGLTPGLGIQHEYLDIHIKGKDIQVQRIALDKKSSNPLKYLGNTLDFYQDLNQFNHQHLGWNYIPSVSIQYKGGLKSIQTAWGKSIAGTISASAERRIDKDGKQAFYLTPTIVAGTQDIHAHLELGYKYSLLGNYNKGLYVGAGGTANGGLITGKGSAGVGIRAAIGAEYQNWTLEAGYEKATNYNAQTLTVGYRF